MKILLIYQMKIVTLSNKILLIFKWNFVNLSNEKFVNSQNENC